jgi:class 3 adenylate cyclase
LIDQILRSRSAVEGERKQVTVFFVDVKESMHLAERVDPEEWHRMMDRFFAILADGIHRFEGTINQFTGDGVMALFGAPLAHEDHAQRACYAALQVREQVRLWARELKRGRGLTFAVRMGLNSGEVIVGTIGDDLRMDYTAQGHTVGLAARMQQIAEGDGIYLTAHTAALVSSFFELQAVGRVRLKGVRAPVRTFALIDAARIRTRLEAARARGFSPFVGRGDEVALLEAGLSRAIAGHGQVIGVAGAAGVGKSRLCREAIERWRAEGTAVVEAHCPAHGKALPFATLRDRRTRAPRSAGGRSARACAVCIAGWSPRRRCCSTSWDFPIRNPRHRRSRRPSGAPDSSPSCGAWCKRTAPRRRPCC